MKRALTCIISIVVLGVMLMSADAFQQVIPERLRGRDTLLFGNVDNAYREFWGHSKEPIEIQSKNVSVRDVSEGREAIFQGNVKVNRSDITLTCDKLVMLVTANRRYFTATGNVTIPRSELLGMYRGTGKTYRFFLRDERDRLFP